MNLSDRFVRHRDIRRASDFIVPGMRILAFGMGQDWLLSQPGLGGPGSVGLDPSLTNEVTTERGHRRLPWCASSGIPAGLGRFDAVVFNGLPVPADGLADLVANHLRGEGLLVVLVPSPIAAWLPAARSALLRLVGKPARIVERPTDPAQVFSLPRFRLLRHLHCCFGSRRLLVFERTDLPSS